VAYSSGNRCKLAPCRFAEFRLALLRSAQIANVLDTDREADQSIIDAKGSSLLGWYGGMGHDAGMLNQAFDTAKALG